MITPSQILATFAADLRYQAIPDEVVRYTEDLFLDWYASAVAGCPAPPVKAMVALTEQMGPSQGPCTLFGSSKTTGNSCIPRVCFKE